MFKELSDEDIKAIILSKVENRGCWGARYMPLDTLVRWLSRKIRRNGKRVQRAIKQLLNDGSILLHKKGETVSLDPVRSREISEFIETISPTFGNPMYQ